jgi:uncharacterized membrane protein
VSETTQSGLSDNAVGAISYITFVPAVVFLILPPYNTSPFVRFHAWQSILFSIAVFVVDIALSFFLGFAVLASTFGAFGIAHLIWGLVGLIWFLLWIVCIVKAINGQRFQLPIIGAIAEQLANK